MRKNLKIDDFGDESKSNRIFTICNHGVERRDVFLEVIGYKQGTTYKLRFREFSANGQFLKEIYVQDRNWITKYSDGNWHNFLFVVRRQDMKNPNFELYLDGRLIDIASIRQAEVLVQKAKLIGCL